MSLWQYLSCLITWNEANGEKKANLPSDEEFENILAEHYARDGNRD